MRVSVLLASCVLALAPTLANAAPGRQACLDAYDETQVSMRRDRLLRARDSLATCLDTACPPALRADCADWLKEVEARTPSVVIECVTDGVSVRDVRLLVDGAVRAEGIDGRAMDLDPGNHVFRVEPRDSAPVVVEVIVGEGEKLKPVRIALPSHFVRATPGPIAPATSHAAPGEPRRPVPWIVYAAAGVGGFAAVGFTVFAISGASGKSDLQPCKPDCSSSQISDVRSRFITADVFLGVSLVALGAAAILYLTRPALSTSAFSTGAVRF